MNILRTHSFLSNHRSRSVTYGQSLLAEAEAFGHATRTLHRVA
ncbi:MULTISPECIES: hypothetical protein [unclassified Moorena]|nr:MULTISPECIES: hypothetical protein [unclassified Moorena]